MIDRQVGDHSFQVRLRPGGQRSNHDGTNREGEQPRPKHRNLVRKERQQQPDKTVNSHFGERTGQYHRDTGRRAFISVRQPGVKRKERNLDRESKKDSGKGEPFNVAGKQVAGFCKIGETGEIERALGKIDPEERKQHRHATEKSIKEEFCGRAVAFFASPDFNKEESRNEAHLVEEKPENKILGGERAVESGLHNQHQRAETAISRWTRLCKQGEWKYQRSKDEKK